MKVIRREPEPRKQGDPHYRLLDKDLPTWWVWVTRFPRKPEPRDAEPLSEPQGLDDAVE
ncbi:hypothetical protein LIP_3549 [Limnochorda pilosa]|uniref:Uncharacterized protein n=1 Tax=Limnochorda pilosa TaxID=1555112 RepID=A0A0K2SQF8_LIMPI|nr:hypothetical protein LIP_3549 [Limnochorda pilosa]